MMVEFTEDQLSALNALLSLVHYDDLAYEWHRMLPLEILVYRYEHRRVARREAR